MTSPIAKFLTTTKKSLGTSLSDSATPMWIGATVVFAVLFFMSSILDMKIKVSFGQSTGSAGLFQTSAPSSAPSTTQSGGGIASQVGGC